MCITKGTVADGRIVVEGEPLGGGSTVTVLVTGESGFTLNVEQEPALLVSIAEADRGELLDAEDVLNRLAETRRCCRSR
jgi:hypothetical protein